MLGNDSQSDRLVLTADESCLECTKCAVFWRPSARERRGCTFLCEVKFGLLLEGVKGFRLKVGLLAIIARLCPETRDDCTAFALFCLAFFPR